MLVRGTGPSTCLGQARSWDKTALSDRRQPCSRSVYVLVVLRAFRLSNMLHGNMLEGLAALPLPEPSGANEVLDDRERNEPPLQMRSGLHGLGALFHQKRTLAAFIGEEYRGTGHAQYLLACRAAKRAKDETAVARRDQAALENVWNGQRLRESTKVGDVVAGMHSNTYDPAGVALQGWQQIGGNRTYRAGIDGQHKGLGILSTFPPCMNPLFI